jgi:hypothetical protein
MAHRAVLSTVAKLSRPSNGTIIQALLPFLKRGVGVFSPRVKKQIPSN